MGAIQAQDFTMAKWAIANRLGNCTEQEVEVAFNRGDFIRTHIMRPTWHFVSSDDLKWLLLLSGERIKAICNSYVKELSISNSENSKSFRLLERILRDNNHLTKEEIIVYLENEGLGTTPRHHNHFLRYAEAEGIICSGSLKGKKQTYALLDERIPKANPIHKDEALAKLAQKYMRSHSPATLQDFIWWSGLTIKDCRHAVGLIENELIKDRFDSTELYIHEAYKETIPLTDDCFHFLSAYDEYIISYKNRVDVLDLEHHSKAFNNFGIFQPIILFNGHAVGNWKIIKKTKSIEFDLTFWNKKFKPKKKLLTLAENKLRNYLKSLS